MKRIILTGGLGNQLFKSLGAIQHSQTKIESISFDVTWYQEKTFTNGLTAPRRFELADFPSFSKVPLLVTNSLLSRFENRMIEAHPQLMTRMGYCLNFDNSTKKCVPARVYKCDFEDFSTLPSKGEILDYLRFPDKTSAWSQELKKIAKSEKAIAVHVRRNDYLNFSNIYPKLGLAYYSSAVTYIRSKLGNLPLWLFSDDPIGAMKELGNHIKFDKIVIAPANVPSIENLELFSLMKGVVTANSTFSWWGAYLGTSNGNVEEVTIPEKYTTLEQDPGLRLRTPGWKIIPN